MILVGFLSIFLSWPLKGILHFLLIILGLILAYFVLYLKIINTFLKKNICIL